LLSEAHPKKALVNPPTPNLEMIATQLWGAAHPHNPRKRAPAQFQKQNNNLIIVLHF
jgi:hypothetical protein